MKKYKIELYEFNKKTSELESIVTLKTKEVTEQKLAEIVLNELSKSHTFCWAVNPRPKNLTKLMSQE